MAAPSPLVSVAWLSEHLADRDLRLIHVAPSRRVYNRRHLPGAVYGDLHRELALRGRAPETGAVEREWLVPGREHAGRALARWGVGVGEGGRVERVVFYDDVGLNRQAIRGYWLLRLYRYPADRVHILDGGLAAWRAAGQPTMAEIPAIRPPGSPVALGEADRSLIATADQVLAWGREAAAPGGPTRILDVRTAGEFVGSDVRAARGGHVPGARNRLWSDFVGEDGTIRPVSEILALLHATGVEPADVRATYCQGGVRAALAWFVLHELGGLAEVRNYAGSWEEWGNRPDLPVERD